jgi:hypothetical protein
MKNLVNFILLLTILSSCGEAPKPATCNSIEDCLLVFETSDNKCCGKPGTFLVQNKNLNQVIIASFIEETKLQSENWIQTAFITKTITPQTNQILGCSWNSDYPACYKKRYRTYRACYENEDKCRNQLPSPDGGVKNNCLRCAINENDSCYVIPFSNLNPEQKNAVREMWSKILAPPSQHTFSNNLVTLFIPNPNDTLCKNRKDEILNSEFNSTGCDCNIYPKLGKAIKLLGTKFSYNALQIKFPSVITGKFKNNSNLGQLDFDINLANAIWVTVSLLENSETRRDQISTVYALKKEKKIIISGKNFLCITIKDITID